MNAANANKLPTRSSFMSESTRKAHCTSLPESARSLVSVALVVLVTLAAMMTSPPTAATVTYSWSAGSSCGNGPVTSFSTGGGPFQASLCVSTTADTERGCGFSAILVSATPADSGAFAVTARSLGPSFTDATSAPIMPFLIGDRAPPAPVAVDFGATVAVGGASVAPALDQLLATFTFQPQASATNASYAIVMNAASEFAIAPGLTCFNAANSGAVRPILIAANTQASQQAFPDLVISAMSADSSAPSGAPVSGSVTVVNQGTSSADATRLQFYASLDNLITSADINTGFGCNVPILSPASSYACAGTISALSLAPGFYYFGVIADVNLGLDESNRSNNARAASNPTQITGTPPFTIGMCGAANGSTTPTIPTNMLCNSGIPTPLTGAGPWNWMCAGSSGGTTASCFANKGPASANSFPLIPLILLLL